MKAGTVKQPASRDVAAIDMTCIKNSMVNASRMQKK